ncbi:MAG: hypothetical protein CVU56_25795 [Deltaproteobacteria bacterium HGW-Deltaproteobacteria-14]|nr:MAG: hypothetical protein CVU56_25795 [Deltaproteobacteria bacterium HGW-Deltaproteobacteria-14]
MMRTRRLCAAAAVVLAATSLASACFPGAQSEPGEVAADASTPADVAGEDGAGADGAGEDVVADAASADAAGADAAGADVAGADVAGADVAGADVAGADAANADAAGEDVAGGDAGEDVTVGAVRAVVFSGATLLEGPRGVVRVAPIVGGGARVRWGGTLP